MDKKIVVAIDGFSSCGKSTMAKSLAAEIGYTYIDSGAMYRAVSLFAIKQGLMTEEYIDEPRLFESLPQLKIEFRNNAQGISETYLNGENVEKEIRTLEVANGASRVSTLKPVRLQLVALQREMGEKKSVVMDGRDIGTVVFPQAELKIFLTASPEVRAERRFKELQAKGDTSTLEEVLLNVKERDERDQNRKESPLRQAEDSVVLDNSALTLQEQRDWLLELFRQRTKS